MVFIKELSGKSRSARICDHHGRIGAEVRFEQLFDEGSFDKMLPFPKVKPKTR
jgi:acetyl-CoA carboxylase beta subunit